MGFWDKRLAVKKLSNPRLPEFPVYLLKSLDPMKNILRLICLLGLLLVAKGLDAQPFYGYQTIGVHTWYVGIHWDGEQPHLGVGYGLRRPWGGFTEWTAELRSPLTALFDFDQQSFIVGAYGPMRLRSRPFLGGGLHIRLQNRLEEGQRHSRITLAGTLLPSYTLAAPLGDQPYWTAGVRATGLLVLTDHVKGQSDASWMPAFGAELGAHTDFHLERTAGISLNGYLARYWQLGETELPAADADWQIKGDLHLGSTYYLKRW